MLWYQTTVLWVCPFLNHWGGNPPLERCVTKKKSSEKKRVGLSIRGQLKSQQTNQYTYIQTSI